MRTLIAVLPLLACFAAGPAAACALAVSANGQLRLSSDGLTLGSQLSGSTPATFTAALSLFESAHIDVGAPTVNQSPSGYNASGQAVQVAYTASVLGILTLATQAYTSAQTTVTTGILGSVIITFVAHNRITNPNSFATGTYGTRTTITCRP